MSNTFSRTILTSLTTAALSIPGIAQAQKHDPSLQKADANVEKTQKSTPKKSGLWFGDAVNDLKYTRYIEDGNAYKINVWQAHLVVPVNNWQYELNFMKDSESGATQAIVLPSFLDNRFSANPTALVSGHTGATVQEERSQIDVSAQYNKEEALYRVAGYYSAEDDTLAVALGGNGQWDFNKHNTKLKAGVGVTQEFLKPTPQGVPGTMRRKGQNTEQDYYLALSQDLSKYNYVQLSLAFQYTTGFINDQYRAVSFNGNVAPFSSPGQYTFTPGAALNPVLFPFGYSASIEKKPGKRSVWIPMLRFVQYIPQTDGSAHFDYRYGSSSWGNHSHMFELDYYQPFFSDWEFVPRARYYTQTRAKFYGPTFNVAPGPSTFATVPLRTRYYVSDWRLSGYGTLNFDAKLSYQVTSFMKVGVIAGFYQCKAGYKLGSKDPIPNPITSGNGLVTKYFSIEFNLKL